MQFAALFTQPQYLRHLGPIAAAMDARGHDIIAPRLAASRARPTVVASAADARMVPGPVIYVEHGAGQHYIDAMNEGSGWSGGPGLDHVRLFLCPSDAVAARWRTRYPRAAVAVIGCPALDTFHVEPPEPEPNTIAISFRWNCIVTEEARSALDYYRPHLANIVDDLRSDGWKVLGHGHPRIMRRLTPMWRQLAVEPVEDIDKVLTRASLFAADNTSALYEFASLGRPVLTLNAPWYRRDVEHGLRFWSHIPGIEVDEPRDLPAAALRAAVDPMEQRILRARAVSEAYAHCDGTATSRAVDAIEEAFTHG